MRATAPAPLRCSACDGDNPRWRAIRLLPGLRVLRCRACGVERMHPMPTPAEIRSHYDQYYLTRPDSPESVERLVRLHEPIVDWLLAPMPAIRHNVLDYGFGSGAFLVAMARRGQAAFGIDLSEQNVNQLRSLAAERDLAIGIAGPAASPLEGAFDCERFDLVTLFQVVEHVTEPLELLRRLAARQVSGGRIYIECPNQGAVIAWLKRFTRVTPARRRMWGSLKYPEHLHAFNRRSLATLLERAGYVVECCADYAYRDGVHQVEAECWWPRFRDNPDLRSLFGISRSMIPLLDRIVSSVFGAGSGLYALGRLRGTA